MCKHLPLILAVILIALPVKAGAQANLWQPYEPGEPESLVDLYVSPQGNDANPGTSQAKPLRTLGAAWERADLAKAGYRINLLPGTYPFDEARSAYYADRLGTPEHPLSIRAASGAGTAILEGGMNINHCRYLSLIGLSLRAGGGVPAWGNNVLHLEDCEYVLLLDLTISGPDPARYPDNYEIQETLKANQCQYLYIEGCDISGAYQTAVDYFSVQYGHVLATAIHGSGEWCMYVKGGSAYLAIGGCRFYAARLGFQAGEGSNLEVMRLPWVHYECYDVKFCNNVLHDLAGCGVSAAGAYNFLIAYNTLYKVGISKDPDLNYPMLQFVHGQRACVDTSENGEGNAEQICRDLLAKGAWGTATLTTEGIDCIPNRNVYVYNNLLYNPAPFQTVATHLYVQGAIASLPGMQNIPLPSRCDDNLRIAGNFFWNGPRDQDMGIEDSTTLTEAGLRAANTVNKYEPQLADPAAGDFRPKAGGNLTKAETALIPDFTWDDAPKKPVVPPGVLSNAVPWDAGGNPRPDGAPPGAYGS